MFEKCLFKQAAVISAAALIMTSLFTSCKGKTVNSVSSQTASLSSSEELSSNEAASSSQASVSTLNIVGPNASNSDNNVSKGVSKANYSSKSVFNPVDNKVESKISINNRHIFAPSIPSSAIGASIIPRTTIEGVDGTFYNPKITESPRNLGGKTYTFGTFWTQTWEGGKSATKDNKRCAQALTDIQRDYNCKIKIENLDTGTLLKNTTAAKSSGRVYCDIFELQPEMKSLYTTGNCADLLTVKSVNVKGNQWNPTYILLNSYKNKDYGIGLRYDNIGEEIIYFNKQFDTKYNLGDFYNMVNKGQWTDDVFLQICQRFKKLNNDKSIYACQGLFPNNILNLVYSNWTSPFGITQKKYIFNGSDNSVLNILNFDQGFVKGGLYDTYCDKSDFQANGIFKNCMNDAVNAMTNFNAGKTLFQLAGTERLPYYYANCKCDYGILPYPKGPSAADYTALISSNRYFCLEDGNPDLENAGALLTAMVNRTNLKTTDITANIAAEVRDEQSVNVLENNYRYKQIITNCASDDFMNIYAGAAMNCVLKQSETPKQAMDSISKSAQSAIDVAYGQ